MPKQENMTSAAARCGGRLFDVGIVPESEAREHARDPSPRFRLRVPAHWKSPVSINRFAVEAEKRILEWLNDLGCTTAEVQRARKFDAAGYVGIPFPSLSRDMTVRIGKYLSLWLLWDDVHIESLKDRWSIEAARVRKNRKPENMTRFDEGWWVLLQELAARRSHEWVETLCQEMIAWSDASVKEALLGKAQRERRTLPAFAEQLEMRIATIGMYATVHLLEDAYDFELPRSFHHHPAVKLLKKTANEIVGLGNDIFSLGKDLAEGQLNLVSTLMRERSLSCGDALAHLIQRHNRALATYDHLAFSVAEGWGEETDRMIARWIQDVRYASLGFSLWGAQAPRYTAHKLVIGGQVIEPSFLIGENHSGKGREPRTSFLREDLTRTSYTWSAH